MPLFAGSLRFMSGQHVRLLNVSSHIGQCLSYDFMPISGVIIPVYYTLVMSPSWEQRAELSARDPVSFTMRYHE